MENLNLVSLPNFVSVENLSVEEVEALINRAEYFKNEIGRASCRERV